MYKILGFVGPSGCGKDTAARILENEDNEKYYYVKLHTTRPQRNEEDNGYNFVSPEQFLKEVLDGTMLNAQEFRGWYYGLSKTELKKGKINVLPMSNEMVMQMVEEDANFIDLRIIYLFTDPKERMLHILNREEKPDCYEIARRFLTDKDNYDKNEELWSHCILAIENKYNADLKQQIINGAETAFRLSP